MKNMLVPRPPFGKVESRVFCPCELCRLRFGRLLYPRCTGEPLGMGRLRGFGGNFSAKWVRARQISRDPDRQLEELNG
jgi:hypothetical protein